MMKTSNQKKDERIEQLTEQVDELITELKSKELEIKNLNEKLEIRRLLIDAERGGFKMANEIVDHYLGKISDWAFEDLIATCQESAFELDASFENRAQVISLEDVISTIYAVKEKYFQRRQI